MEKKNELNDNLRYMLEDLFGVLDRDEIVECKKTEDWSELPPLIEVGASCAMTLSYQDYIITSIGGE